MEGWKAIHRLYNNSITPRSLSVRQVNLNFKLAGRSLVKACLSSKSLIHLITFQLDQKLYITKNKQKTRAELDLAPATS